jgi:hypothetical protein
MEALMRKLLCGVLSVALVACCVRATMAGPPPPPPPKWPKWPKPPIVKFLPVPAPIFVSPVRPVRPVYVLDASNPAPVAFIRLVNPTENMVTLKYRLNDGVLRSLPAGYSIAIHQQAVVSFDRGGAAGWARYSMTDGTYKFVPVDGLWSMVHDTAGEVPTTQIAEADSNPVPAK